MDIGKDEFVNATAGNPKVPLRAAAAAVDIFHLARCTSDATEFRAEAIAGFAPYIDALRAGLAKTTKTPTAETGRDFLRVVFHARRYCIDNFAPAHDTLILTHSMRVQIAELRGLNWESEDAAFAGESVDVAALLGSGAAPAQPGLH